MTLHDEVVGRTIVQSDLRAIYRSLVRRIITTGITVIVVLIISYIISSKLQGIIANPVLHLTHISTRVSENKDYGLRAHIFSNDEIGSLTRSFNDMLGEVEKRDNELLEREQMIAAKNRELEQIVYVVSHDLRFPLVNVDGYSRELEFSLGDISRVMEEHGSSDCPVEKALLVEIPDIKNALQLIRNSTRQMDKLLKGLLQLSRSGRASLTLETVDTRALLNRISATFDYQLREQGIVMSVEPLPPCLADDIQLGQIFSNLISNAIKYRDPEKVLTIKISGREHGGHVTYCVEDTGIGIAKEHQEKVFELFHRLDPSSHEGDGLGLTIVRQSLWRMDGTIRVESEPGRGSCFFCHASYGDPEQSII